AHVDVSRPAIATVRRQHISDPGQALHNVPASAGLGRAPAIVTAPSLPKPLKPRWSGAETRRLKGENRSPSPDHVDLALEGDVAGPGEGRRHAFSIWRRPARSGISSAGSPGRTRARRT